MGSVMGAVCVSLLSVYMLIEHVIVLRQMKTVNIATVFIEESRTITCIIIVLGQRFATC